MRILVCVMLLVFSSYGLCAELAIQPGAYQTTLYLPLLKNKRVALLANPASRLDRNHLLDVLLKHHVQVVKIFAVEHGFRGSHDEKFTDSIDTQTGIPITSLYGKKLKPTVDDLRDVDIIVFDIQDVGVRFYTYLSSLQKLMEAAIENNKPLVLLDRPNPNGFYIDGPILEKKYFSFTGMQPIPVVYGMTLGEYARLLVGERWLDVIPKARAHTLKLTVIPCVNYTHKRLYHLPIKPSPNLPTMQSIYWYPSLGLFEGTVISVGRGTPKPFQQFGHPLLPTAYTFTPRADLSLVKPPFVDQICHGWDLTNTVAETLKTLDNKLQIRYLLEAYRLFPDKDHFFERFGYIAGNDTFKNQIIAGVDEASIRASWQPALDHFKQIRKHYLLYPDFY